MFAIIYLLGTFIADLLKSRRRLEVENLGQRPFWLGAHRRLGQSRVIQTIRRCSGRLRIMLS
jgi:hypothetical protein